MLKKIITPFILMIGIGVSTNQTAYADQAVALKDINLMESCNVSSHTLKKGEIIDVKYESGKAYAEIEKDYTYCRIPKEDILLTQKEVGVTFLATNQSKLYSSPSPFSGVVHQFNEETEVLILENSNVGWVKVSSHSGTIGWMHISNIHKNEVLEPSGEEWFVQSTTEINGKVFYKGDKLFLNMYGIGKFLFEIEGKFYEIDEGLVGREKPSFIYRELVEEAKKHLGKPYVWAGNGSPGFDCSGLTKHVFATQGIELPRISVQQSTLGEYVSFNDLQEGDLLFYNTSQKGVSHVAIYIGNGEMIHAAGKDVHIRSIHAKYWKDRFMFGKRL